MVKKIIIITALLSSISIIFLFSSCVPQVDQSELQQQLDLMDDKIDKLNSENMELKSRLEESPDTEEIKEETEIEFHRIDLFEDGSGDIGSIDEAIKIIQPGGTIILNPGTYYPESNLIIEKPVTIIGSGKENTIIVYNSSPNIIEYTGMGVLSISDVTLRREGFEWGDVIWIKSGEIAVLDCSISGATHFEKEEEGSVGGGMGVLIWGENTRGIIRNCIIENNSVDGIHIRDRSSIDLLQNICRYNIQYGISYWDETGGIVRGNDCPSNEDSGISLRDLSSTVLIDNTCSDNGYSGIEFYGEMVSIAKDNICSGNGYHGFAVGGLSGPHIIENICEDNNEVGIVFFENSKGFAISNDCIDNEYGIYIEKESDPVLLNNNFTDNDIDVQDNR